MFKKNTDQVATDLYITTEHNRKNKKAKTSLAVVMNKVLLGSVVLATLASSITPAMATTEPVVTGTQSVKNTVTQNYEASVENVIFNIRETLNLLDQMKAKGVVTDKVLNDLANGVLDLQKSVELSGKGATTEVIGVLLEVEDAVKDLNTAGAEKVLNYVSLAKELLNITDNVSTITLEQAKATNFSDLRGHWGEPSIEYLVGRGAIAGYPDGTFKPDKTISFAEFLKIVVNSVIPASEIHKVDNPITEHWANGVYQTAVEKGIIKSSEFRADLMVYDSPISRENMSLILIRASELILNEGKVSTANTKNLMDDYTKIATSRQYYVEQAYQKGLLTGKGTGFDPKGNTTRAEASAVIVRLTDSAKRVEVKAPSTKPTTPTTPVQTSDIFITEGPNAGRVKRSVASEYDLQALKTTKFVKENDKYNFQINLPDVPDGVYWDARVIIKDTEDNNMYSSPYTMFTGKEGKINLEIDKISDSNISKVGSISLAVWVFTEKGDNVMHIISSEVPNKVGENSTQSTSDRKILDFDTTDIFNWK